MAATENRDTVARNQFGLLPMGVADGVHIYAGTLAVKNATGFAEPGSTALNKVALGRAKEEVDNTDGADGDLSITIEEGEFKFDNSAAGDAITVADIGSDCYIVDDQTVAKTDGTGTRSKAGVITGVDDDGVWVKVGL